MWHMSSTAAGGAPGPAAQRHGGGGGGGGCCSSGVTLELVGAFTAVCLVLYGVILYFNYLYVRWSGRDGVHRTSGGGGGWSGGEEEAAAAASTRRRWRPSGVQVQGVGVGGGARRRRGGVRGVPERHAGRRRGARAARCGHAFHAGCVDAWLRATAPAPSAARPAVPPPPPAKPPCPKAPEPAAAAGRQPVDLESQV